MRTCFGAWSCGAKKPGKWSEDSFGASIASWMVMPNASRYRMNCSDHCSCWSPPIVPKVIHGLPRRNASEGVSVVRGRLRSEERRVGKECRAQWLQTAGEDRGGDKEKV